MRTVWKFPFTVAEVVAIDAPHPMVPLHAECQEGRPCLWAEVETDNPTITRMFRVYGTGHAIPSGVSHVGSFQDGAFVWHLYEVL